MKPRKTLSVYVLLVGLMGLSIVGGILTFQIFSASLKSQLTTTQKEIIKPIDGDLDQNVMNNLEKRTVITAENLNSLGTATPPISITITPAPTASISSPSASGQ